MKCVRMRFCAIYGQERERGKKKVGGHLALEAIFPPYPAILPNMCVSCLLLMPTIVENC